MPPLTEKQKAQRAAYYQEHKGEICFWQQAYRETTKEYHKAYYQAHKEHYNELQRRRREKARGGPKPKPQIYMFTTGTDFLNIPSPSVE